MNCVPGRPCGARATHVAPGADSSMPAHRLLPLQGLLSRQPSHVRAIKARLYELIDRATSGAALPPTCPPRQAFPSRGPGGERGATPTAAGPLPLSHR